MDSIGRVVVVGSANQDYLVRVVTPPRPGETVLASGLVLQPGGKGANQAVAAARMRGDVSFIAMVGDDADGARLLRVLRSEGVDTSNVEIRHGARTGLALVSVFDSGENSITVIPGANFELSEARVSEAVSRLVGERTGSVVVVQGELQPRIIASALMAGAAGGGRCVLNLAPYVSLPRTALAVADPLVVNEAEASALTGQRVHDLDSACEALTLLARQSRSVVITLGALGACWAAAGERDYVAAISPSSVVDTTGAGDAFVGALASQLARGATLRNAVNVGVRAGSFAVQSMGALASYPTPHDIDL